MATLLLYPLFYGVEVFLASAFATQIAVSVAAVIVSTVTFYYCRHQVNLWRENHEDNILTAILFSFRDQGDAATRARIKIPKPFDEYASGDTDRSSSESEVFEVIQLDSSRLGDEYGSHHQWKIRSPLRSEPTPERSGRDRRGAEGGAPAGLGARSYSLPADRPQRSRRPKQPEAMHRSHWVAKPQSSASIVRKGILIPPSEGEIQCFPAVPPLKRRRDRSRESPSRRTQLTSSSSSLSNSSAESEDVHVIPSSGCTDISPTANDTHKPKEILTKVLRPIVPSIRVDCSKDDTTIPETESSPTQEEIKEIDIQEKSTATSPDDTRDVLSSELTSSESPSETTLAIVSPTKKDSSSDTTPRTANLTRFTATCTSTVTVRVTPSSDDNQTEKHKRRGSPPVILAAIACDDDSSNQIDEIVLPYRRPVHSFSSPQVTHEEPPKPVTDECSDGSSSPSSVVSSEEIHLTRQNSLGVPPVFVGEVSFPGPVDNRPPPPPYSVAIKDVTPRLPKTEDTNITSKLDIPQVPTGEISFPPLREPSDELARLEQIERNRASVISKRLGNLKTRPRSLDIPIVVTTPDEEGDPSFEGHGVKRKQSSILKRSNSTDRPAQKKSVTFSPDIPPYDDTKRVSRRGGRVCRRQRAIRHHSVDSPDPTIPHAEFDFSSVLAIRNDDKPPPSYEEFMKMYPPGKWSEGDPIESETFSRSPVVNEGPSQGTIVFERSWPHPFSQTKSLQSNTDTDTADKDKKSAKDRFFEACGAKAVISVLCTQESISEPNILMPDLDSADSHSSTATTDSSAVDLSKQTPEPPDVTYTATRPLSDRGAAKIRFFGSKENELLTSRLFVQTVRYSIDSDVLETEKSSVPNSPTLVEEEEPKDDDEDEDSTSAKSRFLLSCTDEKDEKEVTDGKEEKEEEEEEQEQEEDHADDEASSMAPAIDSSRSKRQPEKIKVRGELKQLPSLTIRESDDEEEESSSDDDRDVLHSISSRGSDRYRGFLEASNEDIGFFDSDDTTEDEDSEENLETDCSSITSMATGAETPSVGTPSPIEEQPPPVDTGMSTMTRPSIKYTNVWSATAGSPDLHSQTAIVLDNGSEVLKAGMAGSYLPSIVIPTVIGRRKLSETSGDLARAKTKRAYIGHEVMGSKHDAMSFDYPIEDGIVDNWNDLEAIWEHVMLQELSLTPDGEHPILLSEIASAPREQREKCLEVMFEKLNVPALYVANQAALALYANADTSGLVLSSGSGITEVVPVLDGNTLKHAVTTLDIGGKEVTRQLGRLLQMEKGYSFSSSPERETLRNMKESLAYVCPDYEAEMLRVKHAAAAEYRLPDGSPLSVGQSDLFRCTEPLFQPDIAGIMHQSGMSNLITESLQRCDSEFLSTQEPSILLTGGNTKITGFVDRLRSELTRAKVDRVITAPEERIYSTWVGGSILASHSSFSERWISTSDYAEHGANIVNRRSSLF